MQDFPGNSKYLILEKIGQGVFGLAYKVLNKDNNNLYVIKKILWNNAKEQEKNKIKNEAKLLKSLNCEYIVKYYDSFSDNDSFNIVMEYCDSLDLKKFIDDHKKKSKFIEKDLIYQIISDICLGIKEIHNKKIIHRDLKPSNLFIGGDLKIKIGDFGVAKQLLNYNEYTNTRTGTLSYTAPEIINGEQYNNKVDIWSLGCIIYELCTLNVCFEDDSLTSLINKIIESKKERINNNIYGSDLQNLIDLLLIKDRTKRPDIDKIIAEINKFTKKFDHEKKIELFFNNEVYEEYNIEKDIKNSLDKIARECFEREKNISYKTYFFLYFANPITYLLAMGYILSFGQLKGLLNKYIINIHKFSNYIFDLDKKEKFLEDNSIIIHFIKSKLSQNIKGKIDKKLLCEKIIVYNKDKFESSIKKTQKVLMSQKNIKNLKELSSKNFNILLLGGTNVGKSTLINEFLQLENDKKAKEGEGGETLTIDFTPYTGTRNKQAYTLYDTNGMTLEGKDSIENKKKNTLKEIKERIKKHNPNELIHCIWYCITGSIIQKADGSFIKDLLDIYILYKIPIIFVHTKSFSNTDYKVCKKGLKKILTEICKGNEALVNEYLNNYIKVIAREDDEGDENEEGEEVQKAKPCGLDKLERISKKEIIEKGLKSSYYEYIRQNILDILVNSAFNMVFHKEHMNKLQEIVTKDIKEYLTQILNILNNDKLNLNNEIKNNNKISLNKMYNSFKNVKESNIDEFKIFLTMEYLKKDNEKFIKEIYDNKSEKYKKEMNFIEFKKNVENLIYDNIIHSSKEIINNLININFNSYIIQIMKNGIKSQFQENEEEYIKQIYSLLFE